MRNEDLRIPQPGTHPVLVLGGSKFIGGPVRIAPGSGSKPPTDDEVALPVDPGDCDPENALTKHTRFRIHENRRIDPSKLRTYVCKLKEPKLKDLKVLREQFP